ncbi:Rpn family recombination-promoting nuclease/putative transposase [Palleniella muris]|uniref:Rpn family recombination-promoting nuclease/putative transposase n=1 Tax=Palleniella muris TaxID=3038145 RepID=A0AC61QNH2_9BACT|nr:Rpn family recombination-promoting nuclease/putative transposase [Palleniella muris]TGX81167.1 Rpn family recombination-promoting nuclease/putative transposase [Palleniella muris]
MNDCNKYIRFDWAAKRMLRDNANFGVLEGLVTVLLNEEVKIIELLESESNQDARDDKFNRVDIKALNSKNEIIIVEIQQSRELYFLERILYGSAKAITEHISLGEKYDKVRKVYSINILYFDLGHGADYLYHGKVSFVGVHKHDELKITTKEEDVIKIKTPEEIFPEYFIIRVNEFNDVAKTPLEEWMDYLKNGNIKDDTTAPGLSEARTKLQYLSMSRQEKSAYDKHVENIMVQNDILDTAKMEGRAEGLKEGIEQGRLETAKALHQMGLSNEPIAQATKLSIEKLKELFI